MIVEILETLFLALTVLMIAYLFRHYVFTLTVLKNGQKRGKSTSEDSSFEPTVSILIPAHNEGQVIDKILQRMTELTYPKGKTQVIIIDDASTDNTRRIAEDFSKTHDYIEVRSRNEHQGGKGKASALNFGFKSAAGEIVVCFDADYYPQKDILENLTREFRDPKVGAVQGRVTVLNEPQNLVTRLVALERIGGYRVDQQARHTLDLIPQFGGTVGAVRRTLLESLGGWGEDTLAEDIDLTFQVYLAGYKVSYMQDAECYEEAVESWRAYVKQRNRWAKGHMQCSFKHSLNVLRSNKLTSWEKLDGILLLNVYFMPVMALLSWIVGIPLFFMKYQEWFSVLWTAVPISIYSCVGNFAPFFEVGIGAYLDGRTRIQWLLPLLIFTFLLNIVICTKALADLLFSKLFGRDSNQWSKTPHYGNGNAYIGK